MKSIFYKIISSIKSRGIKNTLIVIYQNLVFLIKYKGISVKLSLLKFLHRGNLIVQHGEKSFKYYGDGDRAEILYHAFWNKMFSEEKERIKEFIKPGDTVIDVGGNLGFFVLILQELVGVRGKIIAFEPSGLLYNKLKKTIELNNLKNVLIENIGLGEKVESVTLNYNPKQSGLSSIIKNFEEDLTEEIEITTLDIYSEKLRDKVSFIKIDTEGYEPQILKGAKSLIARDRPIIYLELGGEYQASSAMALDLLKEFDYKCEIDKSDLTTVPIGTNFVAIPNEYLR